MRRGQSASEYLIMVAGVIFVAVFLFLVIKGELVRGSTVRTSLVTGSYIDEYGKPYKFYDNFDTNTSYKWQGRTDSDWRIREGALQRYAINDFLPITAGDESWEHYKVGADVKVGASSDQVYLVARATDQLFYACGLENAGPPPGSGHIVILLC
ncbi:MAG: hypothetical protein V1708_05485, partial [Candidatus Micrarchaeota archaeon]